MGWYTFQMAEAWFDKAFLKHTSEYVGGKITLNEYKCWLFPNSWYLEFEANHPVHHVKLILAEHSGQHLHGFVFSEEDLKKALGERIEHQCHDCDPPKIMESIDGCWLCKTCGYATS